MAGTKALAVLTLLAVATQVAGTRSLLADTLSGRRREAPPRTRAEPEFARRRFPSGE